MANPPPPVDEGWAIALADVALDRGDGSNDKELWAAAVAEFEREESPSADASWGAALAAMGAAPSEDPSDDNPLSDGGSPMDADEPDAPQGAEADQLMVADGTPPDLSDIAIFSRKVPDTELDMESVKVAQFMVVDNRNICNMAIEAARLGISENKGAWMRDLSAACCLEMERVQWDMLMGAIAEAPASGPIEPLLYIELISYDGVDMKVKSKAQPFETAPGASGENTNEGSAQSTKGIRRSRWASEVCVGQSKLLNSEYARWLLLRAGEQYIMIHGETLSYLQTMDHNSAECIKAAVDRLSDTMHSDKFAQRLRIAVTDRHGSNLRCERHVMGNRPTWTALHFFCNVHVWARIHTRVFALQDGAISSMIALSLSLATGAHMSLFRASFRRVLAKTLVVVRRPPDVQAEAYRTLVLDRFLGRGSNNMERRGVILRLAGGDWRVQDAFHFYTQGDEPRDEILGLLYSSFVPVLAGHQPRTFPRARWSGVQEALQDLGLLACIHGLLKSVCLDFYFENFGGPSGFGAQQDVPCLDDAPMEIGSVGGDRIGVQFSGDRGDASSWAAINRATRRKALAWLQLGDPARDLIILATVSPPMVQARGKEIELSGMVSETLSFAATLRRGPDNNMPHPDLSRCALVVAAEQSIEKEFGAELARLQQVDEYKAYPDSWRTLSIQHDLFRAFSREGASAHELVATERQQFPFMLFRLLKEPGIASDLAASCEPSRDDYSASFLSRHAGKLCSDEARMELIVVALASRTTTVRLESLNATIRRRVTALGVQVKPPTLSTISAEFLLGKFRRRMVSSRFPPGHRQFRKVLKSSVKARSAEGALASGARKRRKGGGGAWRAFVRMRCHGTERADFKVLATEYRSLTDDQLREYEDLGTLATLAHRQGGRAFGVSARGVQAALEGDRLRTRRLQLEDVAEAQVARDDHVVVAASCAEVSLQVDELRLRTRTERKLKRRFLEAEAAQVQAWCDLDGVNATGRTLGLLPSLGRHALSLRAAPAGAKTTFLRWCCPLDIEVPRLLGLRKHPRLQKVFETYVEKWHRKHDIIFQHEQGVLPEGDDTNPRAKPACLVAKVCLCGEFGDHVWKLKSGFNGMLKRLLRDLALKGAAMENSVVLAFAAHVAADENGGADERPLKDWKFVHLSMLYQSPFRPTFRLLELMPATATEQTRGRRTLTLRATDDYLTLFEFAKSEVMQHNDEVVSWRLRAHTMVVSSRPVVLLDPRMVEIGMNFCEESFVWNRRKIIMTRQQNARSVDQAWNDAAGALEADCCEGEPSDDEVIAADEDMSVGEEHGEAGGQWSDDDLFELAQLVGEEHILEEPSLASDRTDPRTSHHDGEGDAHAIASEVCNSTSDSDSSSSSVSSSSSSSSEESVARADVEVPPPPVPEGPRAQRAKAAEVEVHIPGGILRLHTKSSRMMAHCRQHGLNTCRLTRTINASRATGREGQGRPLGLLAAWLASSTHEDIGDECHHKAMQTFDYQTRSSARASVSELPGMAPFLAAERPPRDDEELEPQVVP